MIYIFPVFIVTMMMLAIVSLLNESIIKKFITLNNQAQGVKTEITPTTIKLAKFGAALAILGCCALLYFFFAHALPDYEANRGPKTPTYFEYSPK